MMLPAAVRQLADGLSQIMQSLRDKYMQPKVLIIVVLLFVGLVFFFWPGYPPNQFIQSLISGKSPQQGQTSQTQSKTKLNSHKTPQLVNIEFQSGVAKEDEEKIIEGIRIMDFYLNSWFGHSIDKKVLMTVDASSKNSILEERDGEMVAVLHINEPIWQTLRQFITQYNMDMRSRFAAHEYVHFYQKDFGCGRIYKPEQVRLRWLMEGEAEWLSYKAMMDSGNLSSFLGLEEVLRVTVQGGNLQPLKTYKEAEAEVQLYSYFALAVEQLMKDRDIKTLDDFCANVGKGQEASVAFENAFGIPLEKFYSDFANYYKNPKP